MDTKVEFLLENPEPLPLAADPSGVIRLTGTRVTLDTVAEAFDEGATAEEIVQQYPSLSLADVYSVFGYILRHRGEMADYLAERDRQKGAVRKQNEERFSPNGVRARLLARKQRSNDRPGV